LTCLGPVPQEDKIHPFVCSGPDIFVQGQTYSEVLDAVKNYHLNEKVSHEKESNTGMLNDGNRGQEMPVVPQWAHNKR